MKNLIDFTDRGVFLIINTYEKPDTMSHPLLRISELIETKQINFKFNSISEFVDNYKEFKPAILDEDLIIPIDVINTNLKDFFKISKTEVPTYGFFIIRSEILRKQDRFLKIINNHKGKITNSTKKDLIKEIKTILIQLNNCTFNKTYNVYGFDYKGNTLCTMNNVLAYEIFDNYKESRIKRLFLKVFPETMQGPEFYKKNIMAKYTPRKISLEDIVQTRLKCNPLSNLMTSYSEVTDLDELLEIKYDNKTELYSKINFLEEFIEDYKNDCAKPFIKKTILNWSDSLFEQLQ